MRASPLALGLALALAATACKKDKAEVPDAGVGPERIADEELAFQLDLPPQWRLEGGEDAGVAGRLAEGRRRPEKGRAYLVAPKLVVSVEPARTEDVDAVIRQTMNDLRSIEQKGARVNRSALSTRIVDGVTLGDIEIAYEVGEKKQTPREVVQRSLVTLRPRSDGTRAVWTLTVTYMSEDAEVVAPEVQAMLAGLRFAAPGAKPEEP